MGERLIEKLDRLGAEAGIQGMTPELRRFALLVRADMVAQQEQEPVAGVAYVDDLDLWHFYPMRETDNFPDGTKFYTTPPPDDAHLQYGPISTALRDMAEDDGTWRTDLRWNIAHIVANEFNDYYDWQCEPDYPLFYLFLAEFLADEGM